MIVALAGGVGGAKLASGLAQVLSPQALTVVVNTGDDFRHLGLHISPDVDTVMYTLAGIANAQTGWGIAEDSWHFMEALERLGGETWFRLGDRDLATHAERTRQLKAGVSLSRVTLSLSSALGVAQCVVPMSDDPVRTIVLTDTGALPFQEYFVKRHAEPVAQAVQYQGIRRARPSSAWVAAMSRPDLAGVVICPSNPHLSVQPILSIPGAVSGLRRSGAPVVAVSPIVGGRALKGPAAKLMRELGLEATALGVARGYQGLIWGFVLDSADAALAGAVRDLGIEPLVVNSIMHTPEDRQRLARDVLSFLQTLRSAPRAYARR
jgi:LPPG:FO 2-phospho-L-lactate transferase